MLGHGGFAQFSRRIEGEESDRSSSVLSGEEELAAGVNRNVATSAIGASHTGEFLKLSTGDLISNGTRAVVPTTNGAENFPLGWRVRNPGEPTGAASLEEENFPLSGLKVAW